MIYEKDIEKHLVDLTRRAGGLCFKFTSPGRTGVPDRIVIYNGQTFFVELKRPGEEPRPDQVYIHEEMKKRGIFVYVLDSKQSVEEFLTSIGVEIKPPKQTKINDKTIKSFTLLD